MSGSSAMVMPLLARGRHRNPRRGACFMELVSYLAGETWSDSPECTDESLAHLARMVNDFSSDADRPQLAQMIPAVIGLQGLGHGFAEDVALIAATHALPVVAEERQRGLAVGMLRLIGEVGDYRTAADPQVVAAARQVLAEHRGIEQWARGFADRVSVTGSADSAATAMTEIAVRGLAEACVPDTQPRMREVLRAAIHQAHQRLGRAPAEPPVLHPSVWAGVVRPA